MLLRDPRISAAELGGYPVADHVVEKCANLGQLITAAEKYDSAAGEIGFYEVRSRLDQSRGPWTRVVLTTVVVKLAGARCYNVGQSRHSLAPVLCFASRVCRREVATFRIRECSENVAAEFQLIICSSTMS